MDNNRPSIFEVLGEVAGLAFTLGLMTMVAFPFALPILALGLLALPLLLPVLLIAALYGMVVVARRAFSALRRRPGRSKPRANWANVEPCRTTRPRPTTAFAQRR